MAVYRHSFVFEMDTETPVRLWTGHGRLAVGGTTYLGAAELLSIPDIKQFVNGVSQRIEFGLSGISDTAIRILEEERDSVHLAKSRFGRVAFDQDWQIISGIAWEWEGVADVLTIHSGPSDNGRTRSITVGMGNSDTFRSNRQPAFFTDADQRRGHPTDKFFSHVAKITAGASRRFGPK